ncbi:MAG: hypothetical protein J0L79_01720 [Rickettsiales bacterium]|nr:hypothetical protein [Rickettsiales bacterium]
MKTRHIDAAGNNTLLSGVIDENFKINPGNRIILEEGATFRGAQVGGQILYNDEYVVKIFSLSASGELELVPEHPVGEPDEGDVDEAPKPSDFLTVERHVSGSKLGELAQGLGLAPLVIPPPDFSYPIEEASIFPHVLSRSVSCSDIPPPLPLTRSIAAPLPESPSQEQQFPRLSPEPEEEEVSNSPLFGLYREPTAFWVKGEELVGASLGSVVSSDPRSPTQSPTSEDGVLFEITPQLLTRSVSVVPDMSQLGLVSQGYVASSLPRDGVVVTPPVPSLDRELTPPMGRDEVVSSSNPEGAMIHVVPGQATAHQESNNQEKLSLQEVLGMNLSSDPSKSDGAEVQVVGEGHGDAVKADLCCGCIIL